MKDYVWIYMGSVIILSFNEEIAVEIGLENSM